MAKVVGERERILARLDEVMRELMAIRRMLEALQEEPRSEAAVEQLYGSLGHGTWAEYDPDLEWTRFDVP